VKQIEASSIELYQMLLRVLAIIVVASLVWLPGFGRVITSQAHEKATVRPDPLLLQIDVGSTGVVNIRVEDVIDLYGFEFQLTFDETLVEGVQVQPGDFLSPDWILENTIDNDNGTIAYALCQQSPSEPQSGDGVLVTITWRGKALGTSPIHFDYVKLGAPGPVPIPAETQDGEITVSGPFRIYLPVICRVY
jgi:hypothetical protein